MEGPIKAYHIALPFTFLKAFSEICYSSYILRRLQNFAKSPYMKFTWSKTECLDWIVIMDHFKFKVFGPDIKKSLLKADEVHFDASLKVLQKLHGQKLVEKLIHKQQWLEELNFFSLTQLWRIEEFMSVVSNLSSDIKSDNRWAKRLIDQASDVPSIIFFS